jgi:hypothetical protein
MAMNRNVIYAITAVTVVSLALNIVTIHMLKDLNKDINMRISNIENRIGNLEGETSRITTSVTSSIKNLLEENASSIKEKSHSVISYDKESKSSDVKMIVKLKEVERNCRIYIKEEKSGVTNTISVESLGGLTYAVNRKYKIDDTAKLSIIIDGSTIREEYLFDINLKKLLQDRITHGGGGISYGYSPAKREINYSQKFIVRNNYENDEALKISSVNTVLVANGELIFKENYNSFNSNESQKIVDNQNGVEEFTIDINNEYTFKEDTNLKLKVEVTDNLGLTYEYNEEYTVSMDGNINYGDVNTNKENRGFRLK